MLNPIPVLADDFWGDSMIKWKAMFFLDLIIEPQDMR
jgi:hypothetical protein